MHDEDFSCSICLDILIEPQIIQCGHTFCRICIEECRNISDNCPYCHTFFNALIPDRRLESITMCWMQKQGRGDEYAAKRERNRELISLRKASLVYLWTTLHRQPNRTMPLDEILNKNPKLKDEVYRQIRIQNGIGLKVYTDKDTNVRENNEQFEQNGTPCNAFAAIMIAYIVLGAIFFSCLIRLLVQFLIRRCIRREQQFRRTQSETDIFYPPTIEETVSQANQNFGFTDPPPRYEQLFKRGESTSANPPSYEQSARSMSMLSVENLDHPTPTLSESMDMENVAANILTHAQQCAHRYTAQGAQNLIATITTPSSSSSEGHLQPPQENAPPEYQTR
ncbi:unnamed protein product [Caenorhabditis bovis]|uniref:RING-type domain-containing protein n=1 Tax=Caenorhabditis bovis TaxID=2654633 RepID=A0A8S1ECH5_9PELO|nr:unnamed protein product [Caenorhabditis bovis]